VARVRRLETPLLLSANPYRNGPKTYLSAGAGSVMRLHRMAGAVESPLLLHPFFALQATMSRLLRVAEAILVRGYLRTPSTSQTPQVARARVGGRRAIGLSLVNAMFTRRGQRTSQGQQWGQ
jgi:hypothetical protein